MSASVTGDKKAKKRRRPEKKEENSHDLIPDMRLEQFFQTTSIVREIRIKRPLGNREQ